MSETIKFPPPGLPRRLAAMVYDTCLVLPLVMVTVAIGMIVPAVLGHEPTGEIGTALLDANIVRLIAFIAVVGFFSVFWLKSGQTLAMQAWRIKLVNSSGGDIRWWQAIVRCLGAVLSAACLGAGYWWCLIDTRGRYWHDYLSGTELILLPKKEKKEKR